MPIYEFLCEKCGLKFEKMFSRMTAEKSCPCASCGEDSKRLVSSFSHSFAVDVKGIGPQNTGVHNIDYNPDQVIGRDAAAKWEQIEKRNAEKDQVIAQEKKAGLDVKRDQLVKTAEGYRTITEPERVAANSNRAAATEVNKMIAEKIRKKES
jgi:putative FmdB family regulatory protein